MLHQAQDLRILYIKSSAVRTKSDIAKTKHTFKNSKILGLRFKNKTR